MYDNTLIVVVSDNGGPLDHATNYPLKGSKHTFWEGGLRVEAFISGGALPSSLHNTTWDGLLHASDWYLTLTEGVAGVSVNPAMTGGLGRWMASMPGPPFLPALRRPAPKSSTK